jgi:hypothetical protein
MGGTKITPQSSKAKGRRGQQLVRDEFLKAFPTLEPDDIKSTSMGVTGEDLALSPAARKLIPYQIEIKNKATSQVHTYMDQCKGHGKYEPLVVVKKDRGELLAIISLDHFLTLITKTNETGS